MELHGYEFNVVDGEDSTIPAEVLASASTVLKIFNGDDVLVVVDAV